jgi:hypothetical protein
MDQPHSRFALEAGASLMTGLLAVVTTVWPDWIELVLRVDPDHHSGVAEWAIVAALACISLTLAVSARFAWRRLHPAG